MTHSNGNGPATREALNNRYSTLGNVKPQNKRNRWGDKKEDDKSSSWISNTTDDFK